MWLVHTARRRVGWETWRCSAVRTVLAAGGWSEAVGRCLVVDGRYQVEGVTSSAVRSGRGACSGTCDYSWILWTVERESERAV